MENRMGPISLSRFDFTAGEDSGQLWQKWIRSFKFMLQAMNIENDDIKYKMFLHYMGDKAQEVFERLQDSQEDVMRGPLLLVERYIPHQTKFEIVVEKLTEYFAPKQNRTYERHMFRLMKQEQTENIAAFAIRLDIQAARCDFGADKENQIKDQIIAECQSPALRHEMLNREEASLKEILKVAKIFEAVVKQEKVLNNTIEAMRGVNEVAKISLDQSRRRFSSQNQNRFSFDKSVGCQRCGMLGHNAADESCPAKGKTCFKCGGSNHFGRNCRSKKRLRSFSENPNQYFSKQSHSTNDERQHNLQENEVVKHISEDKEEYVFGITDCDSKYEVQCKIGGVVSNGVIDSGSKYNLMDQKTWESLKAQKVVVRNQYKHSGKVFKAYGGHTLEILGVFDAQIEFGKENRMAQFYVIKGSGSLLIGRDTAESLGVLKINCEVNKVESVVETHGPLNKIKDLIIEIPIKTDVKPVIQPYRRVPVALEKAVDKKINELLAQDIIEKVNGPSKWISPVVVVPKENDVRICIDMRRANEAVQRENHPLPTIEDFLPHIGGGKIFSKLDVKNAFHQVV